MCLGNEGSNHESARLREAGAANRGNHNARSRTTAPEGIGREAQRAGINHERDEIR